MNNLFTGRIMETQRTTLFMLYKGQNLQQRNLVKTILKSVILET